MIFYLLQDAVLWYHSTNSFNSGLTFTRTTKEFWVFSISFIGHKGSVVSVGVPDGQLRSNNVHEAQMGPNGV